MCAFRNPVQGIGKSADIQQTKLNPLRIFMSYSTYDYVMGSNNLEYSEVETSLITNDEFIKISHNNAIFCNIFNAGLNGSSRFSERKHSL